MASSEVRGREGSRLQGLRGAINASIGVTPNAHVEDELALNVWRLNDE
jgi:hypothetical protein